MVNTVDFHKRCHKKRINRREGKDYKEPGNCKNESPKPEGEKKMIGLKTGRSVHGMSLKIQLSIHIILQETYQ